MSVSRRQETWSTYSRSLREGRTRQRNTSSSPGNGEQGSAIKVASLALVTQRLVKTSPRFRDRHRVGAAVARRRLDVA